MINTHLGYWDVPLFTNTVAGDYTIRSLEWITFSTILLLDMSWSSWSLPLGPYTWSSPQKSLCWGDDPPIRNTRNLHPGTSRIKTRDTNLLHNGWLLHLGVLIYFCIARSFGGNANSWFSFPMFQLKTKTNPSPLGRLEKTLKIMETSLMNPI